MRLFGGRPNRDRLLNQANRYNSLANIHWSQGKTKKANEYRRLSQALFARAEDMKR